jgi:hypothetical protein
MRVITSEEMEVGPEPTLDLAALCQDVLPEA